VNDPLDQLRAALEGRYAVERLIGQGGMATVYLARDSRHDRPVAIKVLRPELAASLGADRFLREIKVAAHLQHPNILALYDSGEAGTFLYYVMPFIEGESLRARLDRESQLSLPDAIQLTCEIADALHYAHAHRVIHRDIKPENVLIQEGHALVADFGIARAVSEAGGDKLTETGMAVGTPHYMSPEQALGGEHLDGRADQYSLACVFYEMLVGQPPFDGPNAMAILARQSMESVPSLQVVRHSIPDEVEDAVMRALEKTPADRFPTVREFADALLQADLGPTARRTSPRALQAVRRITPRGVKAPQSAGGRGARFWAVSFVGLAMVAAAGLGAWRTWHPSAVESGLVTGGLDPHRIAVLYFQGEGRGDSLGYLADGLTEGLIRDLDQVQGLEVISKGGVAPYRGEGVSRDSIARALEAGTLVTGGLEQAGGRLRVNVRLVDGSSGADFGRASFEHPTGNLLAVQDTLTQRVAGLIRERLGEEIRLREQRTETKSVEAWALVQRAEVARKQAEALVEKNDTTQAVPRSFDQADSLYNEAHRADPRWTEPLVGRAGIAYRRSRLVGLDGVSAKPWIGKGENFANEALSINRQDPDALELRGTLRYWSWLLNLEPDPKAAKQLLTSAESDLETAVKVRPTQAGAWATLSHLYNNTKGETDAKLAGIRAYEADAYLSSAAQVINRLFIASYDLAQFVDAARWCDEGARRFPHDFNFTKCQLWVMSTKVREPDVAVAWKLADSVSKLSPVGRRDYDSREARMIVAMVLARAGLADSARQVAQRARGGPDVDPNQDLAYSEIYVHVLRGDKDQALEALKSYLAANPERRAALADTSETLSNWWLRSLEDDRRFRRLVFGK
jgi:TolB-like protein/tRNA A-37 threonylcarbamoyl transferase component Bud32/tetratricopeptide (TPR) repeat protein